MNMTNGRTAFETIRHRVQFCVVGGGMAGMCAAIAAARRGVKTLLMHDRPVFGGNASSEVRMWVRGAKQPDCRETGIIEEIRLENLRRNTYPSYSVWDSILYEKVRFQENLTSLLNCSCMDAEMDGSRIRAVKGWQSTTQTFHLVEADYFADCSGDSILAPLTGADFRIGREARTEFGETLAVEEADKRTMGMSCLIQARETDSPKKFIPPAWAKKYPTDASMSNRCHQLTGGNNFWWLELGGEEDSIRDSETIRDELLAVAFGVWDHIKNHGDHHAENWALDWVGFLPGKRESRRMLGDLILTQNDIMTGKISPDIIAYGGWPIDDHHPGGIEHNGAANVNILLEKPYGIPYRCVYSRNVDNLFFAGRNISISHVALSSTRVMATCAALGQAVGTAAAAGAAHGGISPREIGKSHIAEVQEMLLDDDCFLLDLRRKIPALTADAALTASGGDAEELRRGVDRDWHGVRHGWSCAPGDFAEYDFGTVRQVRELRLVFDSDLSRPPHNMVAHYFLGGDEYRSPATLVRDFHIEADGRELCRVTGNGQRLVRLRTDVRARKLRLVVDDADAETRIFAFEAK